jgi:hypothetical protein
LGGWHADPGQESAQGVLLALVEGADGGGGDALGLGAGAGQLVRTGLGEVQPGDPAVRGMRAPGDQAACFQAVDHVGNRAGRYVQGLADLAHGAVTLG